MTRHWRAPSAPTLTRALPPWQGRDSRVSSTARIAAPGEARIVAKREPKPRNRLVSAAKRGGVTLVIGAGVSLGRRVPDWETLAHRLWDEAFPDQPSPWDAADDARSPRQLPQFLPIIFELAQRKLGDAAFLQALEKHLYAGASFPLGDGRFRHSNESLAVLARLLVQEHKRRNNRRIVAVVTFNVDDFIEQAVDAVVGRARQPGRGIGIRRLAIPARAAVARTGPAILADPRRDVLHMIARATHSYQREPTRPIPVYHIHGFVPSNYARRYGRFFDHRLVFTDTQYWSTSATATSFANRIIGSALSEGCCVFIGLSMTDINLLRWLALRTIERDQDWSAATAGGAQKWREDSFNNMFDRHFWIRTEASDPSGFISEFLKQRGITSVPLRTWRGTAFRTLMEACFPDV
jgi:hypothetical protein